MKVTFHKQIGDNKMKYGRSLSFCVSDILKGRVAKEDVGVIVTSTACQTSSDWDKLIKSYSNSYWRNYLPECCRDLVMWLLDNGHIYQPRLVNGMIQSLGEYREIWVDSYQEALESLRHF